MLRKVLTDQGLDSGAHTIAYHLTRSTGPHPHPQRPGGSCNDEGSSPPTAEAPEERVPSGSLFWIAMPKALVTSTEVGAASIDQPTTRRENTSSTTEQ